MSRKKTNMIGRAETIHSGNQVGLSMIQITDDEGRLLAFWERSLLDLRRAGRHRRQVSAA